MTLVTTAISIEPETEPTLAVDRRPYMLATRSNAAVEAKDIDVSTTRERLSASLARRRTLYIKSVDGNPDLYVGGSDVTSTNGYVIREKEELWLDVTPDCAVHAITASGTADVRILEAGV